MSLTGPDFWSPEKSSVMPTAVGQVCFLCEQIILRDPAWTWAGSGSQVWLHVGCAADFALRIFSDLHVWQKKGERRFHELDNR